MKSDECETKTEIERNGKLYRTLKTDLGGGGGGGGGREVLEAYSEYGS